MKVRRAVYAYCLTKLIGHGKKNPRNEEKKFYGRAAYASADRVEIYGTTVEEVGNLFLEDAGKTRAKDLRAIKQGRYAAYLLDQAKNGNDDITYTLRKAANILEDALGILEGMEHAGSHKYKHITVEFRKKLGEALTLLNNNCAL
ncbi:MAG: hypothetical protein LIO79_04050 [Rikenellaceae bacterium]|nr:hypothetical protein [Rikenellaceae bacterium]